MIKVFNVYKSYGGNSQALTDVSMRIKAGEFVFLTGPSGAGKTTLLKILNRWENFDRGQIIVHGINISKVDNYNVHTLRRKIGVVYQDYKLLSQKTVFQNVGFAQEALEVSSKTMRIKTWEALSKVGLSHKKDYSPLQLSGGEQQRVAIARALVTSPTILLADEPTGNLDPKIALEILKLFKDANKQGATVIFATHSQEMIQAGDCRVINLDRGKVVDS